MQPEKKIKQGRAEVRARQAAHWQGKVDQGRQATEALEAAKPAAKASAPSDRPKTSPGVA
jgi:hypothetical protein